MKNYIVSTITYFLSTATTLIGSATITFGDIPAPNTKTEGTDWAFVAMGIGFAFAGALLFLWLGRKLTKRS